MHEECTADKEGGIRVEGRPGHGLITNVEYSQHITLDILTGWLINIQFSPHHRLPYLLA